MQSNIKHYLLIALVIVLGFVAVISCSGGGSGDGGSEPPVAATYTIGGTVTGLTGTGLVLQNNDTNDLNITADGSFTFATAITDGSSYNVTVLTQPTATPSQTCTVSNGSGTINGDHMFNIFVNCLTDTYTIGGTVRGLLGTGLVLQNNNTDDLIITTNGNFTFPSPLANAANYNVTILTQPEGQFCTVANATNTVNGANITDVWVECTENAGVAWALYSINGANWNDYVKDDGTDTACNSDIDTSCIHGGERRMWEVSSEASCVGISATDALGAFDWSCDDSTGTVRVISSFKDDKSLTDLIDFAQPDWKQNSITVFKNSVQIDISPSAIWWANPVVSNTTGSAMDKAGTVYVLPSNATASYTFGAERVSLVADAGTQLKGVGGGANSHVISAIGLNYLWLEGIDVNASGDAVGVYWEKTKFSVMHKITVADANTSGVQLFGEWKDYTSAMNNSLSNIISNNNGRGISFHSCSNNMLSNITANNNKDFGVLFSGSNNTLYNAITSNNHTGVYVGNLDNILSNLTVSNNSIHGIYNNHVSNNTYSSVTANNNGSYSIYIEGSAHVTLSGVTTSNNLAGIAIARSSYNTISNITASNNGTGVTLYDASENSFTGVFQVGQWTDCIVTATEPTTNPITNPGLDDDNDPTDQGNDTVHDRLCIQQGASDFGNAITGISLASSFVGKVTTDDIMNSSDSNGNATITNFALPFDWSSFENSYRTWGLDGSAFPDATNRNKIGCSSWETYYTNQAECELNSWTWRGDARIWDWSLQWADTSIKNILSLPTGNDTLTHTWSDLSTITFLRNAAEIQGDDIGNDNTLCESGEECLYTPNMGSYQGHGSLISAGTIGTGGTIENVILWKYDTNGY